MSYISQTQVCAPAIQDALSNNFNMGRSVMMEPLPYLEFLASQANNFGLSQKIVPSPNKTKTVQLVYNQRILETDVDSNLSGLSCSGGDAIGNTYEEYTIDTDVNKYKKITFNLTDLECTNDEFVSFLAQKIDQAMDAVERAISIKEATATPALIGNWSADAVSAYSIVADNLQLTDSDIKTFQKLNTAATMTGYGAQRAVFGGQLVMDFMGYAKAGCCTSSGVDISQLWAQHGIAGMYDRHLTSVLGGHSQAMITQPGSIALINFTMANFDAGKPVASSNYVLLGMFSPRTGLKYDVTISDNCGVVTLMVKGTTKIVGLPTSLFTTTDNFEGVTYVNKFRVV